MKAQNMPRRNQSRLDKRVIQIGAVTLFMMTITFAVSLGYSWSAEQQMLAPLDNGTASISLDESLLRYVRSQWVLIANSLMSGLIVFLLFISLYKNVNQLDMALNASIHDELTGLCNRRYLDEELQRLWLEAKRDKTPISTLFIDIDHFKAINDRYGHEMGDKTLVSVGETIEKCLQRPMDFTCRWGGEEFVVLLPKTSKLGALEVAKKIHNAVQKISLSFISPQPKPLTVSIGVASTLVTEENFHYDLIDQSDKAMMKAKTNGRNRLEVFETHI